MCANTKSLFDQCSTCATALAGVLWCHCNHRDIVQEGIVVKPSEEISPSCIMDRFGELMISDHKEGQFIPRMNDGAFLAHFL